MFLALRITVWEIHSEIFNATETIPPLPGGEGRGEGERKALSIKNVEDALFVSSRTRRPKIAAS